jgi:hypothetical protein
VWPSAPCSRKGSETNASPCAEKATDAASRRERERRHAQQVDRQHRRRVPGLPRAAARAAGQRGAPLGRATAWRSAVGEGLEPEHERAERQRAERSPRGRRSRATRAPSRAACAPRWRSRRGRSAR